MGERLTGSVVGAPVEECWMCGPGAPGWLTLPDYDGSGYQEACPICAPSRQWPSRKALALGLGLSMFFWVPFTICLLWALGGRQVPIDLGVGEALERVVALAAVRGYTRLEHNRPQQVRPYTNMRQPTQAQQSSLPGASSQLASMPRTRINWNQLQVGATVMFGNQPWKVLKTYIYSNFGGGNSASTGTTSSGVNTGSAGKGVNTKGGGGATSSGVSTSSQGSGLNTSPVTDRLRNLRTGRTLDITLPANFKVTVLQVPIISGMEPTVIVPAPQTYDAYVELSGTKEYRGHRWRKHILNLGTLIHPKTGEKLTLDEAWYNRLKDNFDRGTCDIVQVPLADASNKHTEFPLNNTGQVLGLERVGNKVYVDLDIRDPKTHQGLKQGTLLGASAFLNLDYTDTRTGTKAGPTLLHSCITNRPYVLGLDPYQEVVAATASDMDGEVVVLAQEEAVPTKDELIAALKAEHGIDVAALEAAASQQTDLAALTSALTQTLSAGGVHLSAGGDGNVALTDVIGAVAELNNSNVALTGEVNALKRRDAERTVDGFIADGRLLPKSKEKAINMMLSNPADLDDFLAPADDPFIKMNNQDGTPGDEGATRQTIDIDAELARLTSDPSMAHLFNDK